MIIYNQGRVLTFEQLTELALEQKVDAWLIGEFHNERNGKEFQKRCARQLKPEFILTEGEDFKVQLRYLFKITKEIGGTIINCDTADTKEINLGEKSALTFKYGTDNIEKIAREHYKLQNTSFIKKFTNGNINALNKHQKRLKKDPQYKKFFEDVKRTEYEGSWYAREIVMGKIILEYIKKSKKPILGIFGITHLKLRAGNLFGQLEEKCLLLIKPLKLSKKDSKIKIDSYDTIILRPQIKEFYY